MALSPAKQDIEYYNEAAITKSYTITDNDGAAVDLSGKTLTLTAAKKKGDTPVHTLSTATEITISGASNNVVNIAFDHDFVDERWFYYDLWNTTDDYPIIYGFIKVTKQVPA